MTIKLLTIVQPGSQLVLPCSHVSSRICYALVIFVSKPRLQCMAYRRSFRGHHERSLRSEYYEVLRSLVNIKLIRLSLRNYFTVRDSRTATSQTHLIRVCNSYLYHTGQRTTCSRTVNPKIFIKQIFWAMTSKTYAGRAKVG